MSLLASTWRSVWRFHRVLAAILVLEYAFTFAIVLAASGILVARVTAINQTSGVDEHGLYVLQGMGINQPVHRSDLFDAKERFQAVAGRGRVAFGSSLPFLGSRAKVQSIAVPGAPISAQPLEANGYAADPAFFQVLGLRLLQGRGFRADEMVYRYGDSSHLVMLSSDLAERLFHDEEAVGKQVDIAGQMRTVVGVFSPLAAPAYFGNRSTTYTYLLPERAGADLIVIRYDGPVANLARTLVALRKSDEGNVRWSLLPYTTIRESYFRSDRLAVAALIGVMSIVLVTALCGILGLTNYWVARRKHQIATRRALGARKRDISLHFVGESSLLVVTGLLSGLVLDVSLGLFFANLRIEIGPAMLLLSIGLVLLLAWVVVFTSLRRWLRLDPAELMRSG
ncbi:MAG TPA: FtsX-like permease family protein [Dyella sp.]|nr:FtsX-like permease family protein [Dyella sp.]